MHQVESRTEQGVFLHVIPVILLQFHGVAQYSGKYRDYKG